MKVKRLGLGKQPRPLFLNGLDFYAAQVNVHQRNDIGRTGMDEEVKAMQDQIIDAVANFGSVAVISALAVALRMAAEVEKGGGNWPAAGTQNYYAKTLEDLLPEE
jgi:hypothetical protein